MTLQELKKRRQPYKAVSSALRMKFHGVIILPINIQSVLFIVSADTKYRLLHQHCDARGSLNPPQRYYLRPAATGETRWGVSTCGYCDNTKIHFSGSGYEVRSGSEVSIVASNDMILDCDQWKCPINFSRIRFRINKCGGRDGDAININDAVMFYTTYKGKRCQVSFNRADPFLWCPGTPLAEPPTDYDCNNSCGTVVFVQSG